MVGRYYRWWRGTTAYVDKRYYRPPERYYRWGAGSGGYVGAGGGFSSPIPIRTAPSSLFLSPATPRRGRAPAGRRLRAIPLHSLRWSRSPPRPLAMDADNAPVPSFVLSPFSSCFLGAMVVASLDFWLNLGLSSLEKASRLCGLSFGRIIFEFGSPVVSDLTTAVGTAGSPSCAVLPLPLGRYYRLRGRDQMRARRCTGQRAVESPERYYRVPLRYYRKAGNTRRRESMEVKITFVPTSAHAAMPGQSPRYYRARGAVLPRRARM